MSPTMTKFTQEFVRGDKEGILLQDAADDDHGMGPHDINHRVGPKFAELVGTDDCIVVAAPDVVYPRLELNDIVDTRPILDRPVHTTTNATERESSPGLAASQLLKHRNHAIRIEATIRKVDVGVDANLQLSAPFRGRRVDSSGCQASEMVLTLIRIHHMNRPMATLKAIFYKWEQDPILFLITVEEGADVTGFVELGTGKRNGSGDLLHCISPHRIPTGHFNKDAILRAQLSNRYFGMDRYVRPIDSSSQFWLNSARPIGGIMSTAISGSATQWKHIK